MQPIDPAILAQEARTASENAHAPYSRFRVGAAILGTDGSIHTGCNVENASFGLSICAERVAVGRAVTMGCKRFVTMAIFTDTETPTPPCGACRQVLSEFGSHLIIHLANRSGVVASHRLSELFPHAFESGHFVES